MAEIRCEKVSRGMREEEERDDTRCLKRAALFSPCGNRVLTYLDAQYYLPVGVVQQQEPQRVLTCWLPQEPDTGGTRLWVRTADFLQDSRASTWSSRIGKSEQRLVRESELVRVQPI